MPTELQRKWIQALGMLSRTPSGEVPPAREARTAVGGGAPGGGAPGGAATSAQPAARLGGPVGAQGRNARSDVLLVQAALNRQMNAGLAEDGISGGMTIGAIVAFQKQLGLPRPDGRIDPGGPTERALIGNAAAAPDADGPQDDQGGDLSGESGRLEPQDARGGGDASLDPEPDFSRLARQIHDAAEGLGTDEQAIFAALRELKGSPERRARLGEVYRDMFGEDLEQVLRDELDEAERAKADDAANRGGGGGGPDFESLARQIHAATEGLGTDENAINAALAQVRGRPEHMARLREVYRSLFGESLDDVLRDELAGQELKKAQGDLDARREVIPDQGFDEVKVEVEVIDGLEGEVQVEED